MMRKTIFFLCFIFCIQFTIAQRSATFISENRLFLEGKSMYDDHNYAGCIDKLKAYKKLASDKDLIQEADFLLAASAFNQGRKNAVLTLKEYLDIYPETRHYDEVCFMTGSSHFNEKDYLVAIYWFNKANIDNLSVLQQEDYAYRMAVSCLQTNKKEDARRLFGILKDNSLTYRDAATYYTGYLHYSDGEYNQALPLFNKIKDNANFKPEVLYYLAQINFIQGRYAQTIKEGSALLANYPHHENNAEINRIVGASAYYESDYGKAIQYLSQYASQTNTPGGNDLYLLGISHYYQKDYAKAIQSLSKSSPGSDALGQNTYLYLGQAYLKQGDNKNALISFESASRMNFDAQAKETAMYNYAMLLHKNSVSAFGESVTVLENFLNAYPKSIYADKVNDCLIDVYLTTKNYDTALTSIAKIKNPGTKILEARQKIYYHLGTVYFTNMDYDNAVTYFTKAIAGGNYAVNEKDMAIYWRAESYYKKGDLNAAAKDYRAYLQTENTSNGYAALAHYNVGYCSFLQEQYNAAQSSFSTYINLEKDKTKSSFADAYARIGDCYFYNRKFTEAENAYNQSANLQPLMGDYAVFQKGFIMGLQKDYKGKVTQMDNLIKSYPDSRYITDAIYEKGRAYVMLENNSLAIQTYENLLERFPESSNARKAGIQIGLLYFNSNQPQKASVAYKKVIEKYPGSEEAKVAVQDLKSVYFDLNDIGGYADYIKTLGGSLKFEASEQDSLTYLAAEKFFMKGDTRQAQAGMKKYLQSFPDGAFSTNAHYYLGSTYYEQKDYASAKPEFLKVLDAGNNKFTEESVARAAELQYKDKEYETALYSYERLQNIAESKVNQDAGSLGVMRSAFQLSKYADMIKAANRLLKDQPVDPETAIEAKYYRAKSYLGLGEKSQAITDLKELAKDTRTAFGAESKYLLAQTYFDNKELDKAEAEVLDYIKKGTPHSYWLARSYVLLSDAYVAKKDNLQARQYLESLQHNYKNTNDDIHTLINERLTKLN